ncbi:MAG: phosphoribosylglycinamide formyltransferase [Candidatus Omnitrophica bacterium]|nr:phosphoribosylglycinamide formyltransferase [Candidatus Omnitrophota bacterium]
MFTIAVLASGKGSNLQAIINKINDGYLSSVRIGVVLSDNSDSGALKIAEKEGIKSIYVPPGKYRTFLEPGREKEYVRILKENKVELVCFAGFMRIIKEPFFTEFKDKIINIHPSLLPAFPGIEAWKQAFDYGVRFTGCTVHFVQQWPVDSGPVIFQSVIPVLQDDTCETLYQRIQLKEHIIYPLAIKSVSEGRIFISGNKVIIK